VKALFDVVAQCICAWAEKQKTCLNALGFDCALVCLLFIAVGCDGVDPEPSIGTPQPSLVIPTPSPTVPPAVPVGYSKRWLQKVPCAAPCWEGVTPGQTSIQEAISILKQNPGIAAGSVMTHTFGYSDFGSLLWEWTGAEKSSFPLYKGGEVRYDFVEASQKVFEISPSYQYLTGDSESFTLSEVIQAYGEPTHVVAGAGPGLHGEPVFYSLQLLFARNGMKVERGAAIYREIPKLEPSMRFDRVTFSPVPDDPLIAYNQYGEYIPRWEGFRDFAFYCRDIPESRTPSDCPPKQ
jgi:hypothetical protein